MIRIGGTFPGECHLQESESDYCKVKVMTNNKIIGGTFPGECHLHHELDRLHFGRQAQSRMRADELFSMAEIREKILAQIFRQSQNKVILKTFGANIHLFRLHQSWLDVSDTCPAQCAVKQIWNIEILPRQVCCEKILKYCPAQWQCAEKEILKCWK